MQDSVNRLLANRPAYSDDWVPLSRMSREEVRDHLERLAEMKAEFAEHGWPLSRGGWSDQLAPSVGTTSRPCLCGLPHTDPVHVRTVDLTAPAPETEEDR